MVYNPATDFVSLWRNSGGTTVSKLEMPGLDFVISALARAGLLTISVSATAPGANQATTAWLQTAVPSWNAEGTFYLWNGATSVYEPATPVLFFQFLEACAGASGVSLWTTVGGPPSNVVGKNGDYAIRTDDPGGIYGPKALGAWPATPLPGSSNIIESSALDNTFGATVGNIIFRDTAAWAARAVGAINQVLSPIGGVPQWEDLTSILDALFGSDQGVLLFRGASDWEALPPGVDGTVLTTHGISNDPSWTPKVSEFSSGDTMLFKQDAAPTGWTKQTALNNYGLRVVSGLVSEIAGSNFSAVFSQSTVGDTIITTGAMPIHHHNIVAYANAASGPGIGTGGVAQPTSLQSIASDSAGGGGAHNHPVNLSLAYVDVIIATKD